MEKILHGIPNVVVYIDDILVTGRSRAEHLVILDQVLNKLMEFGIKLKKGKCQFLQTAVDYLDTVLTRTGYTQWLAKSQQL